MSNSSALLRFPFKNLSDALDVALPHMRALVSPLTAVMEDPDELIASYIFTLLATYSALTPQFVARDILEAFAARLVDTYGSRTVRLDADRSTDAEALISNYQSQVEMIRRDIWQSGDGL